MVSLSATIDCPGLDQAVRGMADEAAKQAEFVARQASEAAAARASAEAPVYSRVPRTSTKPTGEPYVDRGLLKRQIHADVNLSEGAAYGLTGLLPADGKADRMAPYWQLQNDGQLRPRTIYPRYKPVLRFPVGAWPTKLVECPQGYLTQRGWSFYWVRWPARAPARHFMERGFDAGRERGEAALELALDVVARRWAR